LRIGIGLGEAHALRREPIQVRCLQVLVAVAAQRIPPHVIGQDVQDVRLRGEERRAESKEEKKPVDHGRLFRVRFSMRGGFEGRARKESSSPKMTSPGTCAAPG
jgi:hypothetical protein